MKTVKVVKAEIVTAVSKAGNDYDTLKVTFENGYTLGVYLKPEQAFIINQAAEQK